MPDDDTLQRLNRQIELAEEFLRAPWDTEVVRALEAVTVAEEWGSIIEVTSEAMQDADGTTKVGLSLALARWYGVILEHPEYAVPYLKVAYSLMPNHPRVRRAGGLNLHQRKQHDQAIEELSCALEAAMNVEERAEICCDLAGVLFDMGQGSRGRVAYERALECDPNCLRAREALELPPPAPTRPPEVAPALAPTPAQAQGAAPATAPGNPVAATDPVAPFHSKPPWQQD